MLLTLCLTQARDKNFLLKMVVFCRVSGGHSYSRKREGTSRITLGASRNVPDEAALKNVYLVARAR